MRRVSSFIYRYRAAILIIAGLAGMATSLVLHQRQPKPPQIISLNNAPAPSSVKPKPEAVASYSVPPNDPKYIAIPAISLSNTPVLKLGLLTSGAIATPSNIYETGWYNGSARPGQAGAMFIYGHVSSWTANGIFYNLKKLAPKDQITITRGDNKTYTYQVVSTRTYAYNNVDMGQVLAPVVANTPGLNLMTCTGQLIKGTSEFNQRLVVFTKLVSN